VRIDPWDTGFVDLDGEQGLLGQREGRTGATVVAWLSERGTVFREAVEYVAIDPAAGTRLGDPHGRSAAQRDGCGGPLPPGEAAGNALTKVHRRVTWDLRGRRGRKIDPEYRPTGAACCGLGNACRPRASPPCGTESRPRTRAPRS
jgi:transposase